MITLWADYAELLTLGWSITVVFSFFGRFLWVSVVYSRRQQRMLQWMQFAVDSVIFGRPVAPTLTVTDGPRGQSRNVMRNHYAPLENRVIITFFR